VTDLFSVCRLPIVKYKKRLVSRINPSSLLKINLQNT
jgi:hypothetical protein